MSSHGHALTLGRSSLPTLHSPPPPSPGEFWLHSYASPLLNVLRYAAISPFSLPKAHRLRHYIATGAPVGRYNPSTGGDAAAPSEKTRSRLQQQQAVLRASLASLALHGGEASRKASAPEPQMFAVASDNGHSQPLARVVSPGASPRVEHKAERWGTRPSAPLRQQLAVTDEGDGLVAAHADSNVNPQGTTRPALQLGCPPIFMHGCMHARVLPLRR